MSQALVVRFKESPFSPWGSSNRAVSRGTGASTLPNAPQKLSASVGCISAVNSLIGEKGLQRRSFLPTLITDSSRSSSSAILPKHRTQTLVGLMDHKGKAGAKGKAQQKHLASSAGQHRDQSSSNSSPGKDEKSADTRLIELATYPGYDPHFPTTLPHGMITLEQMKRVTRAQKRLATKREGFRETWRHLFYSPASQAIFQDYFWWFFLHRYQPQQLSNIQDLLFARISNNYVKVLCDKIDPRWKDAFFKVYPDAIAQCVYTAFIHAYPTSWNSFDDNFKTDLCQYISLWQVGTKPIPNSWEKWEFSLLEPPNLLKHVGKDEQSPSKGTKPKDSGGFNFDALLAKEARRTGTSRQAAQSPRSKTSLESESQRKKLSSSSKSLVKDTKRLSFADIERALSSSVQQQAAPVTRTVDPKTQGVSTPPAKLTAVERKKIEVAKQQLNSLQKVMLEKQNKRAPKTTVNGASSSPQKVSPKTTAKPPPLPQQQLGPSKRAIETTTPSKRTTESTKAPSTQDQKRVQAPDIKVTAPKRTQQQRPSVASKITEGSSKPQQTLKAEYLQAQAKKQVSSISSGANSAFTAVVPVAPPSAPTKSNDSSPPRKDVSESTDRSPERPGSKDKEQDSTNTTWKQRALAIKQRQEEEQSTPLQGPAFDHALFNVNGQSPLVKYYMKERDLAREKEYKTLVSRTEISDKPPTSQSLCYKDVLAESKETGTKNQQRFKQHYRQQKRSIAEAQRLRRKAATQHKQNVKMVLSNKKEVRDLSTTLTEYTLLKKKGGDFNKTALTTAVENTLNRVSTKP